MTLTGLSSVDDRTVRPRLFSFPANSVIYQSCLPITTWHDACTFVVAEIHKEPTVPYRSVNPATGEVLKTFPEHTDEQMWSALATADKAFRAWSARPFKERSKIIGKSAQLLLEKKEELARLATLEMGKRIAESRGEVELSASILKYYADNAETFLAPRSLKSIAGEAYIEYSPLGVLIGVQAWNYPYYQLARFAAPHLASRNVMLVKHAPGVPQCALAFEQLFVEAGAPSGAYTNVFLSNDQVAKLIDDPRPRGVGLTA